ncbi:MAG: hypothetical protein M1820_004057 [Bogoriella megaspora]|nr:MAG: hypothetical protein M1820_004057 [Bogoriella megaspora]
MATDQLVQSPKSSRNAILRDIQAMLDEVRALAIQERIGAAMHRKGKALFRCLEEDEDQPEGRPCPFIDKFPAKVRIRIFKHALHCKGKVRVISAGGSRSKIVLNAEAEKLQCTRLCAGIFTVNRQIHAESLAVFYTINTIACTFSGVSRLWFTPLIRNHLTHLEVPLSDISELRALNARATWSATVNLNALIRLADEAPALESITVLIDNLFQEPSSSSYPNSPDSPSTPVSFSFSPRTLVPPPNLGTFTTFLFDHGLGSAVCTSIGVYTLLSHPKVTFHHVHLSSLWYTLTEFHHNRRKSAGSLSLPSPLSPPPSPFPRQSHDLFLANTLLQRWEKEKISGWGGTCKCFAVESRKEGARKGKLRDEGNLLEHEGGGLGCVEVWGVHDLLPMEVEADDGKQKEECIWECRTEGLWKEVWGLGAERFFERDAKSRVVGDENGEKRAQKK